MLRAFLIDMTAKLLSLLSATISSAPGNPEMDSDSNFGKYQYITTSPQTRFGKRPFQSTCGLLGV
jgi:hypothetical protein